MRRRLFVPGVGLVEAPAVPPVSAPGAPGKRDLTRLHCRVGMAPLHTAAGIT